MLRLKYILFKPEVFLTCQTSNTVTLRKLEQYGGNPGPNKELKRIEKSSKEMYLLEFSK